MNAVPNEMVVTVAPGASPHGGGVCSHMSWARLEGILRTAGDVRDNERIEKIKLDKHGMSIYYMDRNK